MIYAASERMRCKVEWIKESPDSEWVYFGENNHIKKALITEIIESFICDEIVYVAVTRKNSFTIGQKEMENAIADLLQTQNFLIWNLKLNKVVEFNQIGVLRKGCTIKNK